MRGLWMMLFLITGLFAGNAWAYERDYAYDVFSGTTGDDTITVGRCSSGGVLYQCACVNSTFTVGEYPVTGADDVVSVYTYSGDDKVRFVATWTSISCGGTSYWLYPMSYNADCPGAGAGYGWILVHAVWDGSGTGGTKVVYGSECDDTVYTDSAGDWVSAGAGDDTVYTYDGGDYIDGGAGVDFINAGNGSDVVFGGTGDDYLQGDYYTGLAGNDCIDDTTVAALNCGLGTDYQTASAWGTGCEYKVAACFPWGPPF